MVFNAMYGNDDDHVPNLLEKPRRWQTQLSTENFDISRETVLADFHHFGFTSRARASDYSRILWQRIEASFDGIAMLLDASWQADMAERLRYNFGVLRGDAVPS